MTFDSEPEYDPDFDPTIDQTEDVLAICTRLFGQYCSEKEIPVQQAGAVNPIGFLEWWREKQDLISTEEVAELIEQAGATQRAYDYVYNLCHDPTGANQLAGVWPQVTLAFRGKLRNEVESMHSVVLLKYRDGRSVVLSSFVPRELVGKDGEFTDGNICTQIQVSARNLMEMVATHGSDTFHDHQSMETPEDIYETLMGVLVLFMQGAEFKHPQTGQMVRCSDAMQSKVRDMKMTLQMLFKPPIPPPVQKMIEERRQQLAKRRGEPQQQKKAPSVFGGPHGGWEDPNS